MSFLDPVFNTVDSLLAWFSTSFKQTTKSYCELETADSKYNLVAKDGSLISIIHLNGVSHLIGNDEFERLYEGLGLTLQSIMKNKMGHAIQVFFQYDNELVVKEIEKVLMPAKNTTKILDIKLDDLFSERINYLAKFCAHEELYLVIWTRPDVLPAGQHKKAMKDKIKLIREKKIPVLINSQNLIATIVELRDEHESIVRNIMNDFNSLGIAVDLLEVHDAIYAIRKSIDYEFTDEFWRPKLPGDPISVRELNDICGEAADILWPPLGQQILSRDVENLDLRTCRIGDKIYSSIFIDLFPQQVKSFHHLFNRITATNVPWRISFFFESGQTNMIRYKALIATILSFASLHNRLLSNAYNMLRYIEINTDDAVVRLRVSLSTWAEEGDIKSLRLRTAELAKAVQGWGTCEVSEICGDPFGGVVSSMLGISSNNMATATIAPLSDVVYMLPFTRPASPWKSGAVLFRSPDGKLYPYQPGSSEQTTWIDLFYARPGSGKSVLSNTINLALCLAPGIKNLPRIAIIDIGPSSSGLISLIKEALPAEKRHEVAYHKIRMTDKYSINPFDTQLGARFPTPQERAFLVNFITLLATPVGQDKPYDGITDMVGIVIDEMYKTLADNVNPRVYTSGIEMFIDDILAEIGFVLDEHTTWWEVCDALFIAGFIHEAILAQRHAVPVLADATSICRIPAIEDLYGEIKSPTGEHLIIAFSRMISAAVREYPILSSITAFDIGDSKIVSLDLDEVAKSGGDAADRQTAIMYMLARYILAKDYYLAEDSLENIALQYRTFHEERAALIRESQKRIVYDEFHRTSKSKSVRDQVVLDMREGRKWNVQIALISQSLDDFDSVMVEFATSIFIMDAGIEQTIEKSAQIFGLSDTAKAALRTRVHGPKEGGATFLAQFATKHGVTMQLLTSTIGPIELWAFSTTSEDANLRNKLYKKLPPSEARRVLANLFPQGTIKSLIEKRLNELRESKSTIIEDDDKSSIIDNLVMEILQAYAKNPDVKYLDK